MIDLKTEEDQWRKKLVDSFFPVEECDVHVGSPPLLSQRYKAIKRRGARVIDEEPFAIVTEAYQLIRHEDAMDLGYEAFERLYGEGLLATMKVFNVLLSDSRGSFLADLTSPSLVRSLGLRGDGADDHVFFLRITNSYNKTRAVRLEAGLCRWICRNGLIFGKQSIRFRDTHQKSKQKLMDHIARHTKFLEVDQMSTNIERAYHVRLNHEGSLILAMLQTLRLSVPPLKGESLNPSSWTQKCFVLEELGQKYEREYGRTAFAVIQASSEWVKRLMSESPIQRDSFERRCGEMLERVQTTYQWPESDLSQSARDEQLRRVHEWALQATHSITRCPSDLASLHH